MSTPSVRKTMKEFWAQHEPTPASMMLNSAGNGILESEDRHDILRACPPLHGKTVLELGAGIGRFTTELAKVCTHVTAVDFIAAYLQKNMESNGHHNHVKLLEADATELEYQPENFDAIFSNWLLMYLEDKELNKQITKFLSWLKPDGYLFIRESCNRPSGDVPLKTNPTYYRSAAEYLCVLQNNIYRDERGSSFRFKCQKVISVEAYVRRYGNPFQLGFVFQKVPCPADLTNESSQALFLNGEQSMERDIRRSELISGKTYVSAGGEATTAELAKALDLKPGQLVLDFGCGIGGPAFFISRNHGVRVHGVDLNIKMVTTAIENQAKTEENVRQNVLFEMSDINMVDYEGNKFDVIYSKDYILHVGSKHDLFAKFLKWLKSGGKLIITDHCQGGKAEPSPNLLNHVRQRGYHLMRVADYGRCLENVGFENVVAEDRTPALIGILKSEVEQLQSAKGEFLKEFSAQDFDDTVDDLNAKIKRCSVGDQAWGFFTATKTQ